MGGVVTKVHAAYFLLTTPIIMNPAYLGTLGQRLRQNYVVTMDSGKHCMYKTRLLQWKVTSRVECF